MRQGYFDPMYVCIVSYLCLVDVDKKCPENVKKNDINITRGYREYSCLIVENNCFICLMLTTDHLGLIY